jgi:hypothetical protein
LQFVGKMKEWSLTRSSYEVGHTLDQCLTTPLHVFPAGARLAAMAGTIAVRPCGVKGNAYRFRQNRGDEVLDRWLVVIAQYSPRKQHSVNCRGPNSMPHDAASSLQGTVEKIIIKPMIPGEAEKVQISIHSGNDPNQRIRIANTLIDARGEAVPLKRGAAVHIVIRPKPEDTI